MKLNIPVILGTARKGRRSEKVAKYILNVCYEYGLESKLIDVRDYLIGYTDDRAVTDEAKRFKANLKDIDGLIIVSPEYSHGFPGELKILIDTLYREVYRRPLGVVAVSNSYGGARAVDSIRTILIDFGMIPIKNALYFAPVDEILSDELKLIDPSFRKKVDRFMKELIWYAKVLKYGRENIPE